MGAQAGTLSVHLAETLPQKAAQQASREVSLSSLGLGMAGGSILGILCTLDFDIFGLTFNSVTNHAYLQVAVIIANFVLVQKCFVDQARTRGKAATGEET